MELIWKKRLNILITYYRKELFKKTKDEQWSQKSFYKYPNSNILICSSATISRVEKNQSILDEESYEILLHKLGQTFHPNEKLFKHIEEQFEDMETKITVYNNDEIVDVFHDISKLLVDQNDIYYKEIYFILNKIIQYYEAEINPTEHTMNKILALFEIYPTGIRHILLRALTKYNFSYENDEVHSFLETNNEINQTNIRDQILYIKKLDMNNNQLKAYFETGKLLASIKSSKDKDSLLAIYCLKLEILQRLDPIEADKLYKKILDYYNHKEWDESVESKVLENLVIYNFYKKDFEEILYLAHQYLEKHDKLKSISTLNCYLFAFHTVGENTDYHIDENDVVHRSKELDKNIFLYLSQYNTRNIIENTKVMSSEIIPLLNHKDRLNIMLCDLELFSICKINKKYSTYIAFKNKFL